MMLLTPPYTPKKQACVVEDDGTQVGNVYGSPKGPVKLISRIGSGSFGNVYAGKIENGGKCAVKLVRYNSCSNAFDFDNEADILEELRRQRTHPHVVAFEGSEFHDDHGLLFFPLADHGSLETFVENAGGRLDLELSHRLHGQLYDGLAYIHSLGIYHRDIKPSNLLMVSDARLQIADFGRSHFCKSKTVPILKDRKGTKPFLPPEAFAAHGFPADAGDLWAATITFATIVCGSIPWKCALADCPEFAALNNGVVLDYWLPLGDFMRVIVCHLRIDVSERTVDERYRKKLHFYKSAN